MKVILKQTVAKIGKEGQVVNVADGFARNFLFPKGLARMADKAGLARLDREQEKLAAEVEKTRGSAQGTADKLNGVTVRLTGTAGKGSTKLFGAITAADIAEAVQKELGVEVDKRSVALMHPIKRLGRYEVMVDLHRDVDALIKVEVANEEGWLGIEETAADAKVSAPETTAPSEESAATEPGSEEPQS